MYDIRTATDAGALVIASLLAAAQRGVAVRLLYDVAHPGPIPVPPPPETTPEAIEALPVPTRGVAGIPGSHAPQVRRPRRRGRLDRLDQLDGRLLVAPGERHRDDRVAARSRTPTPSRSSSSGNAATVEGTGNVDPRPEDVDGARVRAWFCPEHGEALSHRVAKHIGRARERIRIASPVLTSGPILATLVEVVNEHRCDIAGVVDDTQVDQVFGQWKSNGVSEWKIPLLRRILEGAPFSGKTSTRWKPGSVHDFMHAKVVVADDTSFVGSFNFSRSGERNAENVLEIRDSGVADELAAFVDEIRSRYPPATPPR